MQESEHKLLGGAAGSRGLAGTCELFPALIANIDLQRLQLDQNLLVVSQGLLTLPPGDAKNDVMCEKTRATVEPPPSLIHLHACFCQNVFIFFSLSSLVSR